MWLRTESFALRGFSARSFSSFSGWQPNRSSFGKSSAKWLRPILRSSFSEIAFCCLFWFFIAYRFCVRFSLALYRGGFSFFLAPNAWKRRSNRSRLFCDIEETPAKRGSPNFLG